MNQFRPFGQHADVGDEANSISDAVVIAQSRVDPERFALVFDRHFPAIYRYVARRVGPDGADDLAGEVFRIAFERRVAFDPRCASARPWLYGIATNVVRGRYRSEQRKLRALQRSAAAARVAMSDESFDRTVERIDAEAEAGRVALALAFLEGRDRDALVLFAVEGLSYREVADALGVPLGTVRSRINRARSQIRELMSADGQQHRYQHGPEDDGNG